MSAWAQVAMATRSAALLHFGFGEHDSEHTFTVLLTHTFCMTYYDSASFVHISADLEGDLNCSLLGRKQHCKH